MDARCSTDASRKRGNPPSGADIFRPSSRMTRIAASTNSRLSAWTLSRFAEMGMPSLQEFVRVLDNCHAEPRQFTRFKSAQPRELHRLEPMLGGSVPVFDMDVRRLLAFQTGEKNRSAPERKIVGMLSPCVCQFAVLLRLHPHIVPGRVAQRFQLSPARLARRDFVRRLRGQPGEPVGPP
jgi:hypothetical protein